MIMTFARRIPVVVPAICGALVGIFVAAGPLGAQQLPTTQPSLEDLLIQSRSLETPRAVNRNIPLPDGNPLELLHIDGTVYLIAGGPSNVTVQVGEEGVLVVDSATPEVSDDVLKAVRVLSPAPINYIINTTAHPAHYRGNGVLGGSGQNPTVAPRGLAGSGSAQSPGAGGRGRNAALRPSGAIMFSHENLLNRMSLPPEGAEGEPFELWPSNTFFTILKTLWFNEEPIELLHQPAANTDSDIMVFFRRSDVIAAGDIIDSLRYPFIDLEKGGSIQGILAGMNQIIDITVPRFNQQGGTKVIPGHG